MRFCYTLKEGFGIGRSTGLRKTPLLKEGSLRPTKQMPRYLSQGAAGEVRHRNSSVYDLPRRADFLR